MFIRLLTYVEIEVPDDLGPLRAEAVAQRRLDEFREKTLPHDHFGITLARVSLPDLATFKGCLSSYDPLPL